MPFGVSEALLPTLLAQFHRAERSALIRHLQRVSTRSKAGRLVRKLAITGAGCGHRFARAGNRSGQLDDQRRRILTSP